MRKFKQLLLLVISITLVSCHTTGSIKQKAWKVQQGMTTEEIGQLLGKPDFRRFDGSLEQWEYQSGGIATSCKFLIIEFRNGKVTSMDSQDDNRFYNNHHFQHQHKNPQDNYRKNVHDY